MGSIFSNYPRQAFSTVLTSIDEFLNSSELMKVRIDLLEIVSELDEPSGPQPLLGMGFETRCTLEVFTTEAEEPHNGTKMPREECLWRDQKVGTIQFSQDRSNRIKTRVIMPEPFLISADALLVKKRVEAVNGFPDQHYKFCIADQYAIKVWFEALDSESFWPPLSLESYLDSDSRMMTWLDNGTYSNTDIRLLCKGVMFPEGGARDNFGVVIKLGGRRRCTSYTLKLDIRHSLPPPPPPPLRVQLTPVPETDLPRAFRGTEFNQQDETRLSSSPKFPSLSVPRIKGQLYDSVTKCVLEPGTELGPIDDSLEAEWRTVRHVNIIKHHPDIRNDTKDYAMRWNSYVEPLRLSSSFYVSQVLLKFVEENKAWFAEKSCRIREFSLHATSLRLRGSIDIQCLAKCVHSLQDCIQAAKRDTQTDSEAFEDRIPFKEIVNDGQHNERAPTSQESINGERPSSHMEVDENSPSKNSSHLEEATGNLTNGGNTPEQSTPGPSRKRTRDLFDSDLSPEDATTDLETPGLETYSGATPLDRTRPHLPPSYLLHTYWRHLCTRWPRLSLHPASHLGPACVIAAISLSQGFPRDNIDRLLALHIDYCPNENIHDLIHMYHHAPEIAPTKEGVYMTQKRLWRVMAEAGRESCEDWLTDVYRLRDGTRGTVGRALETAMEGEAAWEALWAKIERERGS